MILKIEIHHYHHADEETMFLLKRIDQRTAQMEEEITLIEQRVTELTTQSESIITLLNEIAQLIRDNAGNEERLNQIAADLEARSAALAAAVAANSDVDPTP